MRFTRASFENFQVVNSIYLKLKCWRLIKDETFEDNQICAVEDVSISGGLLYVLELIGFRPWLRRQGSQDI